MSLQYLLSHKVYLTYSSERV